MKSINPATNTLIKAYTPHSPSEVTQILEAVNDAWMSWKETSFTERRTPGGGTG